MVEDDKVIRSNIVEILKMYNYDTMAAENGLEALEILKNYRPDIILSDIMMPEMTGIELLKNLSKNEDFNLVPFLFLSAKTDPNDVRNGMNLGADDYITKPVLHTDLINALEVRLAKLNKIKNNLKSVQADDIRNDLFTDRQKLKLQLNNLSIAEVKVLKLMSENLTSQQISEMLFNSKRTIDNHKRNISKKLNFNKKNQIKSFAVSCKLMGLLDGNVNP